MEKLGKVKLIRAWDLGNAIYIDEGLAKEAARKNGGNARPMILCYAKDKTGFEYYFSPHLISSYNIIKKG